LLPLGNGTVLEQTLANLQKSRLHEIVLVLGAAADSIRQQLSESLLENVKVVVNDAYEQGMASSLRAGLSALSPKIEAALIVLADQPFIRSETFNQIVAEYLRSRAQIVIPMHNGFRGNPVLLDRSVFHEVMALEGDTGCRAIFGSHADGVIKVEVDDPGILLDIDNKEDYERLRHLGVSALNQSSMRGAAVPQTAQEPEAGASELSISQQGLLKKSP